MKLKQMMAVVMVLATPALAQVERTGAASTVFKGKGPAGFKIEGKTEELTLKDDGKTVVISVPLAKLTTGIDLRDAHMRDKYLQVDKFPAAVLEVPWSEIKLPEAGQSLTQKVKGKLTLHGQTKDVVAEYVIKRNGDVYEATGQMPVNFKDFGIDVPNYMGVTVKPDLETNTSFHFKKS
ncbi:YceI family protein [Melittangium boletus]|uniref:YceI family protein n=1 Tax=Melittangium boletus TaxID=83453 RepID=UPI003DA48585